MKTTETSDSLSDSARQLFGIRIHSVGIDEAADVVFTWVAKDQRPCRYVVTPNVDHVVQLQSNAEMHAAYQDASLVVADGWPLVASSWLLRRPLPERVAGSDLVPRLFDKSDPSRPLRVFLLGGAPGVAQAAADKITRKWPGVRIGGIAAPPLGFEQDPAENERLLVEIAQARPDLLIVGLGAPKQEIWLHRFHARLDARVAIAAGGTIDFLAGRQRRAPVWVRRVGLEWLHRLLSDPRRLGRRYAQDAWVFPQILIKEWLGP